MSEISYYDALRQGNLEEIKLYYEKEKNINDILKRGAYYGHLELVKYAVQNGANIRIDNDYPLKWSSENGHLDTVKYLVENGADVNADNSEALWRASSNGHMEIVKFLVENGVDKEYYYYAVKIAYRYGETKIAKYLQKNKK